ncbi:MAG: aminoacyl-tRNA hydrolase [bacterium]|nr:aminoacyl-tRNA hydrolase [bacterium]
MYILVGLGNDAPKYRQTRHNVGFRVVDQLASELGLTWRDTKLYSQAKGELNGAPVLLVKPRLFMNNSGQALQELLNKEQADVSNLLLFYDDLNVPLGVIRVRSEGSHGGHNGVKSVIEQLGSGLFWRFRVGIGPMGSGERNTEPIDSADYSDFVLSKFTGGEEKRMKEVIDFIVERMLAFTSQSTDLKEETITVS